MSAGVFAKKPEFVVGKSIKGQSSAPATPTPEAAKPAAAPAAREPEKKKGGGLGGAWAAASGTVGTCVQASWLAFILVNCKHVALAKLAFCISTA